MKQDKQLLNRFFRKKSSVRIINFMLFYRISKGEYEMSDKKEILGFQNYSLADGSSIEEIIRLLNDEISIVVYGSCNFVNGKGNYHYVMSWKKNSITGEREYEKVTSPNECMLMGIRDAIGRIQKPETINIITSTKLGFSQAFNNKGANSQLINEIYDLLISKGCRFHAYELSGMGSSVQTYVNQFFKDKKIIDKQEQKKFHVKSYEQKLREEWLIEIESVMHELNVDQEFIKKVVTKLNR